MRTVRMGTRRVARVAVAAAVAWVPMVAHPEPLGGADESAIHIGGGDVSIASEIVGTALPPLPDLSRPQEVRIPHGALLETTLPLLWGGTVLPPGEYELTLVIAEDLRIFCGVTATNGRFDGSAPLERADYSEPSQSVEFHLMAARRGGVEQGALQIRWGPLLLQGNFVPLLTVPSEANGWHLSAYRYPNGLPRQSALPIGVLDREAKARTRQHASLVRSMTGEIVVRLEDDAYLRDLAQTRTIRRKIASLQREARAENGATDPAKQLAPLEARLAQLEKRIEESATAAVLEISGETRRRDPATRLTAHSGRLEPAGTTARLLLETDTTTYIFPLPE